jgi:EmrB/QacA subfamily drug resistance transporter
MTTLMTLEHPAPGATPVNGANYDHRWWILGVLGIAQVMVILDSTVVNIALPSAQRALSFSNADRQWIVTGYSLAFGSLLLLGGRIGDRIGRKRALIIGLVGFAVSSAIGGLSVDFAMLVIARTVQGAFGALLAPSVLALLTTTFVDPDERGKAFGIYGAIAGTGGAIGLLLGGILTSYASWRWTLFVNLLFAVAATTGALLWLTNDRGADKNPVDLRGLLLVGVGLFSLVFGFSHAETTSWSDIYTVGFLIGGLILIAAFLFIESSSRDPLLPSRVLLDRTRGGSLLVMLFASVGTFGVFLFLTYYLQGVLKFSPVKSGIAFLPLIGALTVFAQVSNRFLLPRFGPRPIVPVGMLICAASLLGLRQVGLHSSYLGHVLPYLLILGAGSGLSVAPAFSTGTLGLLPQDAGVGSATLNTAQQIGGSIGTALLNTLAASAASSYLHGLRFISPAGTQAAALHGDTTAFLSSAFAFVTGAIAAGLVMRSGNLEALVKRRETPSLDGELAHSGKTELIQVPIACRAC